jgi:hypothetical protein
MSVSLPEPRHLSQSIFSSVLHRGQGRLAIAVLSVDSHSRTTEVKQLILQPMGDLLPIS